MKNWPFFVLICLFLNGKWPETVDWGFFGHRRINRLAVQILPLEVAIFFKPNIDFLTEEATAPDVRRYSDRHEAPRHFIDLDIYGGGKTLSKNWSEAVAEHSDFWLISEKGDTARLFFSCLEERKVVRSDSLLPLFEIENGSGMRLSKLEWKRFLAFFQSKLLPQFYDLEVFEIDRDTLEAWFFENEMGEKATFRKAFAEQKLTEHGILPWNLERVQRRLTDAFREKNGPKILRLAADLGHYVGDAHVPLHTVSNYNGQKTGQTGIHAFWESRLPELFCEEKWSFWVGKPTYLDDPQAAFWATIFESHRLADSVLLIEKILRMEISESEQMEAVDKNGQIQMLPSRAFSAEYDRRLGGMAERRMRSAVLLLASCWLTAWADAGQPDLTQLVDNQGVMERETSFLGRFFGGKMLGRGEGDQ